MVPEMKREVFQGGKGLSVTGEDRFRESSVRLSLGLERRDTYPHTPTGDEPLPSTTGQTHC